MSNSPKIISMDEALALVKRGDKVVTAEGQSAPSGFLSRFHEVAERTKDVTLWTSRMVRSYPFLDKPREGFKHHDTFVTRFIRAGKCGTSYVPAHLSKSGTFSVEWGDADVFVTTATPVWAQTGKHSAGLGATFVKTLLRQSKIRIVEISKNMPYTFGESEFLPEQATYYVECDTPLVHIPTIAEDPRDQTIGRLVAEEIDDGACLQVGIGGIPDALCRYLRQKKHLGVHTEMMCDGLAELIKCGAADGSRKTLNPGIAVTSTIDGDTIFDFVDKNPAIKMFESRYTNDMFILAQNDYQVSVNSILEIDLTGQCCSESHGSTQFSGTGGQTETAIGAQRAKGGKSFMVLRSTTNGKPQTPDGKVPVISKIVPQLKLGAAVSMPRNDVMFVVTEYGMVNLRGRSINERAKLLISIAHPDFREELERKAFELGIIKN